ncbi:peptidase M16 [Idiomarina sp. OT37-5b]|uniref:insulinase family protein n=1 Tax=Idiomarina sp. OT37-5b TaxID=2100422 RepID=UPI000CF96D62|nr:insulinase family protein [Idiomarina sp. OT37-5b]AVJ55519.1 peptidase M16 [Idiomarina sp. OT37-5b]
MASSSIDDEVVHIVRSPRDKRDYRAVRLENNLQALLVHCPGSHKAAAALAVNAGHFDDPEHTQGLAHFLEHMLFLGNSSFPSPSAFSDFLNAYGGQQNAWTGTEYSNFYFDCQASALERALEYFAAMFQQPLLAQEWIDKERQSIESEFRLKQQDELRRLYQVHKSTCNPKHPFSQFSVGNLNTLKDDKHGTLQDKLRRFFKQHYVSDNLRLVIAGPQSLERLAELAETHFSALPSSAQMTTAKKGLAPLYRPDQLGVKLEVKPVKPARRLIITLPLPAIDDDYAHKTTSFIAHILGYEGPQSLFSCLRNRGWINSLSAGGGISGSNFKDFNINIQLTERGEKHALSVAQWVFNYIRLIQDQGIEDWRYEERRLSTELSFKFQEPIPVGELVSQLAVNAHHYPERDIIYGDYRMDCLNNMRANELLNLMVPERARITLISAQANTNKLTLLYDTPYSMRPLQADEVAQLKAPADGFCAQLPRQNRFLNEHFQPYPLEAEQTRPSALIDNDQLTLWHLQDQEFRVPKGHIYLNLEAPQVTASALNFACSRIWAELMIDALNEDLYDAEVAGLHFNIYPTQTGITIHTTGLSAGQLPLLSYLMRQAQTVKFDRSRWQAVTQQLVNNWHSAHQNQPLNLLFSELNLLLQQGLYRLSDMAAACESLSYTHFSHIVANLFKPMRVTGFMHGDWQQQHAGQLAQLIQANTGSNGLNKAPIQQRIKRLLDIERAANPIAVPMQHNDKAALQYVQGASDSPREQVALMLLQQLIHQFVFDELRTRRQLGYMAGSQYFALQRLPGIIIFVQSPNVSEDDLQHQISEALELCFEHLNEMSLKAWAHSKSVLRQQLSVTDRSLRVRSQRLWGAIQLGDTQFDRADQLIRALDDWQLDDWLAYSQRLLFEQPVRLYIQTKADSG